jgi:hypothetical protein
LLSEVTFYFEDWDFRHSFVEEDQRGISTWAVTCWEFLTESCGNVTGHFFEPIRSHPDAQFQHLKLFGNWDSRLIVNSSVPFHSTHYLLTMDISPKSSEPMWVLTLWPWRRRIDGRPNQAHMCVGNIV